MMLSTFLVAAVLLGTVGSSTEIKQGEIGQILRGLPDGTYEWACPDSKALRDTLYKSADGTWRTIKRCEAVD